MIHLFEIWYLVIMEEGGSWFWWFDTEIESRYHVRQDIIENLKILVGSTMRYYR